MSSIRLLVTGLCLAALAALSCSNDPTTSSEPITTDVFFNLNVDGAAIQLNTSAQTYTNPAGNKYGIQHIRFIVSDMKMHTDTGKTVNLANVHYYDIEDASTQTIHAADLVHANYVSVSFTFGLTTGNNVPGKYPGIPSVMNWPTGLGADQGYHYMQLEGNYETDAGTHATAGYTTHTGPRHLDTDPVAYDFSFPVSISFPPTHIHEGGTGNLAITFNLNDWYLDHAPGDGVDTQYDFKTLPNQMIMGDLDAQGKLQTNGPGCFTATLTAVGGHDH